MKSVGNPIVSSLVRYSFLFLLPGWEPNSLLNAPGKNLCKTAGSLPITSHLLQKITKQKKENKIEQFRDALSYQKQFPFLLLTACLTCVWLHSARGHLCTLKPAHLRLLNWPIESQLPPKEYIEILETVPWGCRSVSLFQIAVLSLLLRLLLDVAGPNHPRGHYIQGVNMR